MKYFISYIFILLLFSNLSCNQKNEKDRNEVQNNFTIEQYKELNTFMLHKNLIEVKREGITLPDTLSFNSINKEKIQLNEIINTEKEIFCFVFSNSSCDHCINNAIKQLTKVFNKNNNLDIYIISDFNTRDIRIYKNNYEIIDKSNINILGTKMDFLNTLFKNYPTFFIINKNKKVNKVFIHDISIKETTFEYLQYIRNYYN